MYNIEKIFNKPIKTGKYTKIIITGYANKFNYVKINCYTKKCFSGGKYIILDDFFLTSASYKNVNDVLKTKYIQKIFLREFKKKLTKIIKSI